jgi:hypothetical protein
MAFKNFWSKIFDFFRIVWNTLVSIFIWIKTKKIFKILSGIFKSLSILSILIAIILNISNVYRDLNKRTVSILIGHGYNQTLLNTILEDVKKDELNNGIYQYHFIAGIYQQNLDIIGTLEESCARNYFNLMASLDTINTINESIVNLYNQSGLIFEINQLNNMEKLRVARYKDLEVEVTNAESLFKKAEGCGFHYYTIGGELSGGVKRLFGIN